MKISMKKLDIKAFWLLLTGLIGVIIYHIIDLIANRDVVDFSTLDTIGMEFTEEQIASMEKLVFGIMVFFTIIILLICGYLIYKLFKNKKGEEKQGYITFLLVINIIIGIISLVSLIGGNLISLIDVALAAVIIVGCAIQKKYIPPRVEDDFPDNQNTYGRY